MNEDELKKAELAGFSEGYKHGRIDTRSATLMQVIKMFSASDSDCAKWAADLVRDAMHRGRL